MPADIYERARAYARLAKPATLLDLRDITARQILSRVPEIANVMRTCALAQLDVGALTGRSLQLTQAIAGHLMRRPFEGTAVAITRSRASKTLRC